MLPHLINPTEVHVQPHFFTIYVEVLLQQAISHHTRAPKITKAKRNGKSASSAAKKTQI